MIVEMEMTARLGLKVCHLFDLLKTKISRNGDDSPVGIESLCIAHDLVQAHDVEMEMTARLGLKVFRGKTITLTRSLSKWR